MSESYKIAVAGLGTVGVGLLELLCDNHGLIEARAGRTIKVVAVNARSRDKDRGIDISGYTWCDSPLDMPGLQVDGVVELIGGSDGVALDLARKTLGAGKDFITANKALLAIHGVELAALAAENNAGLVYEAAVAGAVPIVKVMQQSLAGNRVEKLGGILNGTCNFILSAMESTGAAYADVLKEAQDLGYAEADPTTDVGGFDAAHKLTLLAALAFGTAPDFDALEISGIEGVSDRALTYADKLGYRIRLIGLAQPGLTPRVEAMAVPIDSQLGQTTGSHNAVLVVSDQAQSVFLKGPGAGRSETASAVAGDIIDLARGLAAPAFWRSPESGDGASVDEQEARLCLLTVKDEPGVMAHLTQTLASHGVSVDQLLQPGGRDGQSDLVFITHPASRTALKNALAMLGNDAAIFGQIDSYRLERFGA